ncbi:hypothetical protein CVT24_011206 [Panaeolus cyanescens]|uniref:Uncharacterized protein n=1 Tax=Panaeolus cyanescens TaxID=181874 RepID=A0A409YG98_9AGAR|nr:hypothetical protein CVT24_011206 [Panaeolus cyanescens]
MLVPYLYLVTLASSLMVHALPQIGDPIPPPGLYCCPPYGPQGLPLNRQQVGPFAIFCYYSEGTDLGCFYNPGTGAGGSMGIGCPTQAPANPHPPTCPI